MWEDTDQNDSVYEHFLHSVSLIQIDMTAIKHKKISSGLYLPTYH